jgi:putative glutamine amidotransferase
MFASAYYNTCIGPHKDNTRQVDSPPELKGKKLLILWGGEDISPSIYQQEKVMANAGVLPSHRDRCEMQLIKAAVQEGVPILGICRGAQLLCAMGGGSLYQHVENHHSKHEVTYGDYVVMGNSCHHQMMIPNSDMQVLAVTKCLSPRKWLDQRDPITTSDPEPEIVYMPKMKAIAVQGHPEWMAWDSPFVKLVRQLTGEYLNVAL